uniref:Uncharacterized protein n=1 Tax=Romanomermis culicivorax TaxID=13658 RepID=A0A915HTQ3_ROMCU
MPNFSENKPDLADLIRQNKKRHFSPTSDEKSFKGASAANSTAHRDRKSLIPPPTKSSKCEDAEGEHSSDYTSDRSSPSAIPITSSDADEMCKSQSPKSETAYQLTNHQANEMSDFEKRLLIAAKGSILSLNGAEPVAPTITRDIPPGFSSCGLFPPFFGFGSLQMMPVVPPCQTQVFGPPTANIEHDSNKFSPADENTKKKGKWCAMHVKLAWEIYHNAQYRKDRKKMKMMALAARRNEKKRKTSENGSSECVKESNTKNENDSGKAKKIEEKPSTSSIDCNSQASGADNDRHSVSIPPNDFPASRDAAHLHKKSKLKASETAESGRHEDHRRNRQHQQTSFLSHNLQQPQNPQPAQDFYVKSLLMNQFLHHQNQNRQFLMDQHQQQQRLMYQQNAFDRFSTAVYPPPLLQNQQDQYQRDLIATSLLFQQTPQGFYGFRQHQTAPFLPS